MNRTIISNMICAALLLPIGASAQVKVSPHTIKANEAVKQELDFTDKKDFEDATKGFIATVEAPAIYTEDGQVSYTLEGWDFLKKEAPASANPSLWRQSQLNRIHGLFEVIPNKVYQVRGFDIANMSFIRTDSGWVIVDVTTTNAAAKASYDLIKKHVGDYPVKAVIFTHPHGDHYGGIQAIRDGAPNKDFEIIAPEGFMEAALSENVMAGVAMTRRATYMYGMQLEPNEKGFIGTGLGQTISRGSKGIEYPTIEVGKTGYKTTIDGLDIEFIFAPESEAPVEILAYFPQLKAFCTAEDMTHTMHNLLTLRGAKVRNGLQWSKYIDEALQMFGDDVQVSFSSHHWPTWGNENIIPFWETQRDLYRYLHDQTLHLANQGLTPNEIAEEMKLPQSINSQFNARGYYGTLSHNVKSQYQMYFGWFDGNPANLNPLPPTELGKKYIDAMGGAKNVIKIAQEAYNNGDFRWVATLLNNLVFADPENKTARRLLADTYTQLGYQAESGPWRNFYLTGARDLTVKGVPYTSEMINDGVINQMEVGMLLDYCAIQIDGSKADGKEAIINIEFTDSGEKVALLFKNGVLNHRLNRQEKEADLTLALPKTTFVKAYLGGVDLKKEKGVKIVGDIEAFNRLTNATKSANPNFNIVLP